VWPKVLARIHDSNIREYTINYLPSPPYPSPDPNIVGLLIGSFTYIGNDFEGDMAKMAADEVTREWWKLTDPMQSSLIDGAKGSEYGAWWHSCEELFYAP
jgi:L-rhamnose mutarotase